MNIGKRMLYGVRNLFLRTFNKGIKPLGIWFEVTDRCNSRCKHCNIWKKKSSENPLTLEEIEKCLNSPLFSEIKTIINSGGEPILREDIEEIISVEHAIFPHAELELSTNGLMPERMLEIVERMLKKDIPLGVGISLDGIGEKHDLQRGVKNNFVKVDMLLRELVLMRDRYKKVTPSIGFVLSQDTINSYEEVKNYAMKMKVPLTVQWYNISTFYNNVEKKPSITDKEKEKMLQIIKSLPLDPLNELWIGWLKGKPINFKCFASYTFFVLKCNGDIVPCLNLWDLKMGNIREDNFDKIWHSHKSKKARRCVKHCLGCLNSWGVNWSIAHSSVFPQLCFYLRHPRTLMGKIKNKIRSNA